MNDTYISLGDDRVDLRQGGVPRREVIRENFRLRVDISVVPRTQFGAGSRGKHRVKVHPILELLDHLRLRHLGDGLGNCQAHLRAEAIHSGLLDGGTVRQVFNLARSGLRGL